MKSNLTLKCYFISETHSNSRDSFIPHFYDIISGIVFEGHVIPSLESFVELIQNKLSRLDFESKRQALDMLGITLWLDDDIVDITGFLDSSEDVIVTTHPQLPFRIA